MNKEQPREIGPIVEAKEELDNEERGRGGGGGGSKIIQSNQCSPPM